MKLEGWEEIRFNKKMISDLINRCVNKINNLRKFFHSEHEEAETGEQGGKNDA